MNIRDLRDGMRKVDVEGEITGVGETRQTKGGDNVAGADLRDVSGSIELSLWGDDIEKVARGSHVRISNGYTSSYNGKLQLNIGKYGQMEVLGSVDEPPEPEQPTLDTPKGKEPTDHELLKSILAELKKQNKGLDA